MCVTMVYFKMSDCRQIQFCKSTAFGSVLQGKWGNKSSIGSILVLWSLLWLIFAGGSNLCWNWNIFDADGVVCSVVSIVDT